MLRQPDESNGSSGDKTTVTVHRVKLPRRVRWVYAKIRVRLVLEDAWASRSRNPRRWRRRYRWIQEQRRESQRRLEQAVLFGVDLL